MSPSNPNPPTRFVVITGLSGSGKSTALNALEDLGYYAVDNLPVQLLPAFVNLPLSKLGQDFRVATVIDLRSPSFLDIFPTVFSRMRQEGKRLELYFLEADDPALLRRYSETRRQHPLIGEGDAPLEAIQKERRLLQPIRELAMQVIDTSSLTPHDLRQEISTLFRAGGEPAQMQLNLLSFGFKHGIPQEADLVMDVRFLDNPYFVEQLRDLDGRHPRVLDYIFKDGTTHEFLRRFKSLLDFLLPRYLQEGKSQLTLALGCTGGHHRSVAVVEWLASRLAQPGIRITLRHRDIGLD